MSNDAAGPTGGASPHRSNSPLVGIVREPISFGNSLIGPVETVAETPDVATENENFLEDDGSQLMPPLPDTTVPAKAKTTRNKVKFSKQKILGNSTLFLNPRYRGFFADQLVEIDRGSL